MPSHRTYGLGTEFEKWLKDTFGTSRSPLDSLNNDDDWTFLLKTHAYVEAALTHLIVKQLGNPKMQDVVAKMNTASSQTGKLALIKAYDILPEKSCLFVEILCSVRNKAVHYVSNHDLDLVKHVQSLKPRQRSDWRTAMTCSVMGEVTEAQRDDTITDPRGAIFSCCISLIAKVYIVELNSMNPRPPGRRSLWKSGETPYLPNPKE